MANREDDQLDAEKLLTVEDPVNDLPNSKISTRERLINLQWILINILSTVTIVFVNKTVFSDKRLGAAQVSIAAWHFSATTLVLYFSTQRPFKAFTAIRIPIVQMLPIAAFFCGFLLLGNLSLAVNSIGFYQLSKILTTPCVVLLNFILFRMTVSREILMSVVTVCFGVAVSNSQLDTTSFVGTAVAVAAFTITALYQIWIGKKITDLNVSPPQLLLNQAPVAVGLLLIIVPFVDTIPNLATIEPRILWALFASGLIASMLNLSQFLVIGRTSTLTFNIVSQVKTIIILSLNWYMEGRLPTAIEFVGVCLTIGGAYAYSQFQSAKK